MNTQAAKVCSKASHGLYSIRQIRKFLSEEWTNTLVHAFVTSHLDYCKSLLYRIPKCQRDQVQKIVNAAAWMICLIPKFDHTAPFLIKLHWLPVYSRIQFKILLLVFKGLEGKASVFIRDLLKPKVAGGYTLRSDNKRLLQFPKTKCTSWILNPESWILNRPFRSIFMEYPIFGSKTYF